MTGHRTPEPCEYHTNEGGVPHEWAPISASAQQCLVCGRERAIPADCSSDTCQTIADCRKAGHA
jgi:hypothetical protein